MSFSRACCRVWIDGYCVGTDYVFSSVGWSLGSAAGVKGKPGLEDDEIMSTRFKDKLRTAGHELDRAPVQRFALSG
jgi:hypothetical protein